MTLMCADCKSHNIIEIEQYEAWFEDADISKVRIIEVYQNQNDLQPQGFIASCSELSMTATAIGNTPLEAITNLGEILYQMGLGKLKGKHIND